MDSGNQWDAEIKKGLYAIPYCFNDIRFVIRVNIQSVFR